MAFVLISRNTTLPRPLQNNVLMFFSCVSGLFQLVFIPFLLADIFYTSATLQRVAQAIIVPMKPLSITLYVFVITALMYATIGFRNFDDQFVYDEVTRSRRGLGCVRWFASFVSTTTRPSTEPHPLATPLLALGGR